MPTPVNMYFDRINIQSRHQLLKVAQHVSRDRARSILAQQLTALFFFHRRVAAENVEFLLISRLLLDDPISDDEICESVARAPRVITVIENWFVENQIHNGIGNITNLLHGIALLVR